MGCLPGKGHSNIPAAYTYLGQFIAHDITFDLTGAPVDTIAATDLRPRPDLEGMINTRTPVLDLDSLYSDPAPHTGPRGQLMKIGTVTRPNGTQKRPSPGSTASRLHDRARFPPATRQSSSAFSGRASPLSCPGRTRPALAPSALGDPEAAAVTGVAQRTAQGRLQ